MFAKWRKTIVGVDHEGRSKFWVCSNKSCHTRFKIGSQVISKKGAILSEDEIRKNLGLGPKPTKIGPVYANKHKHKFTTSEHKEKLRAHTIRR